MTLGIAGAAYAHDVQNSEIRLVFGEDDLHGSIEIWQTIPLETAYDVVRSSSEPQAVDAEFFDGDVLKIIGQQSLIQSATGPCDLTKQAHRRVDQHGERLQMRFLFTCPDGERPTQMTFAWMSQTPNSHFVVLEQNTGRGSPFKVIERGNPVIKFDRSERPF
ncbi:MAG: hypothetical protein ABJH52_05870 [Henriciella sp.]